MCLVSSSVLNIQITVSNTASIRDFDIQADRNQKGDTFSGMLMSWSSLELNKSPVTSPFVEIYPNCFVII